MRIFGINRTQLKVSVQQAPISKTPAARIDLRRLLTLLLVWVVMPLALTFSLDLLLDTLPILTIVGLLIAVPVGGYFVMRAALQEMDRVIAQVAPPSPEPDQPDHSA